MIFVTVGTAVKGIEFHRLVERMDEIAGQIRDSVVMQIGPLEFKPKHSTCFDYASYQEMLQYFQEAKVIVGHCGSGTVLQAIRCHKPLIVVPRRGSLGEHEDDHQFHLAMRLKTKKMVHIVEDIDQLENALQQAVQGNVPLDGFNLSDRKKLISSIQAYVYELAAQAK